MPDRFTQLMAFLSLRYWPPCDLFGKQSRSLFLIYEIVSAPRYDVSGSRVSGVL